MRNILFFILFFCLGFVNAQKSNVVQKNVYVLKLQDEINAPAWRKVKLALEEAKQKKAHSFILNLNTYGGRVDFADSIRSALLSFRIPTFVFIEENAASAGALISIACDSIFMTPGATIGAATVVDGQGEVAPEKYQSFFRGKMRATAIAKNRNPDIAQAMVDPNIVIEGVVDDKTLITFTTDEAIQNGFCEGKYDNVSTFIAAKFKDYEVVEHQTTVTESIILFLINPAVSGFLIMLIIGGIYFELQTPGVGFPIIIAISAAIAFFAPHYLQGLANHMELIIFIVGLLLLVVEVFVLPGFGIAGISGILLIITGLALSLFPVVSSPELGWILPNINVVMNSFAIVSVCIVLAFILSFYLSKKLLTKRNFISNNAVLKADGKNYKVLLSSKYSNEEILGKHGKTLNVLMPGGTVSIDGENFDSIAITGYIEKGKKVEVVKISNAQLVVKEIN
jgi:membrane-bound serine protease (ClpP class)